MQAPVPVGLCGGDVILDCPGDRCPHLVDQPQHMVAQLLVGERRARWREAQLGDRLGLQYDAQLRLNNTCLGSVDVPFEIQKL